MTPYRSCWILLCFLALLLLIANPFTAATIDNTHHNHELRAVTPGTTGLTISDPNVIDHDEKPICRWRIDHEYPAILVIDVGVSYTTAGYNGKGGVFTAVKNKYGHTKTPSVIAFLPADNNNNSNNIPGSYKVLIGEDAEAQRASSPTNTIYDWQQWIFRPFNQSVVDAVESQDLPYKVVPLPADSSLRRKGFVLRRSVDQAVVQVTLGGGPEGVSNELHFRPECLTAMMVRHIRELAVAQIGNDKRISTEATLVISSELDRDQEEAVRRADAAAKEGGKAGVNPRFKVGRIMSRHTAAPMAYGLENDFIYGSGGIREDVRTLALVNLEEKFLGVDVFEIDPMYQKLAMTERRGERYRFDEEAANRVMMERLVQEFLKGTGESFSAEMILRDDTVMERLRKEVVKMNRIFFVASPHVQPGSNTYFDSPSRHTVPIEIESFFEGRYLSSSVDIVQWQGLRERSLKTILDTIDETLEKSEMYTNYTTGETKPVDKSEVDYVVVMGSSPRIPEAIQLIERYFQGRLVVPQAIDPAFLSVHGASVSAWCEPLSPCAL